MEKPIRRRQDNSSNPCRADRRAAQRKARRPSGRVGDLDFHGSAARPGIVPRWPDRAAARSQVSVLFVLCDSIDGIFRALCRVANELILHQESVFAAILVVRPKDANSAEALGPEKKLSCQIGFAHL